MSAEMADLYNEKTRRAVDWAKNAQLEELEAVIEKNRRDVIEETKRVTTSVIAVLKMHTDQEMSDSQLSVLQRYRETSISDLGNLVILAQRQRELEFILKDRSQ